VPLNFQITFQLSSEFSAGQWRGALLTLADFRTKLWKSLRLTFVYISSYSIASNFFQFLSANGALSLCQWASPPPRYIDITRSCQIRSKYRVSWSLEDYLVWGASYLQQDLRSAFLPISAQGLPAVTLAGLPAIGSSGEARGFTRRFLAGSFG